MAGLLGLGSVTAAIATHRWFFVAGAVAAVVFGFYLNYLRGPTPALSRSLFWTSAVATLVTLIRWGWWLGI